jgi:hypothetical protein
VETVVVVTRQVVMVGKPAIVNSLRVSLDIGPEEPNMSLISPDAPDGLLGSTQEGLIAG